VKALTIVALAALLTGCTTVTKKEVVIETRYVVRTASEAQKRLPPHPRPINVDTANQAELAEWLAQSERRALDLEAIIRRLIEFYEMQPTEDEKKAVEGDNK
jgi:hypothetical protein